MFLPILIIIIAVSGVLVLIISMTDRKKSGWIQFLAKGKDCGFTLKEIDLLHRLAVKSKLEDPSVLFFSQSQLDKCIRALVKNLQLSGGTNEKGNQDFLSKLYDFRKKIEMEKPRVKNGISNSRQISDSQVLRILTKGAGVLKSQVIKNVSNYMTISRPLTAKLPGTFAWQGQKLSVYFWRDDDAGYVFDSEVLDEVFSRGISSLKIAHSDSLFRTQKRKSIRVKIHKAAYLYPVVNEDELNRIEINPGLKCFIEDLSDTGCAITIGGKAQDGIRVKVQFFLNNLPVCMSGNVRSVDLKEDLNRSVLHVEADPLPIEIRNQILGEVFGMLPEDEEELPYRVLEDEEGDMMAESVSEDGNQDYFGEDTDSTGAAF